jgi:hypothetical protein
MKKLLISVLPGVFFSLAAPVIFYVMKTDNINTLSWDEIFGSILLCLAAFGLIYGLAYLATKSVLPSGLIAVLMVVGIFYLWPIALVIGIVVLLYLLVILIFRRKVSFLQLNLLLGMLSFIVLVFYGLQFIKLFIGLPSASAKTILQPVIASGAAVETPAGKPDIYYIILDGYGKADMLQDLYGYDNSGFTTSLEDLGFVLPAASRTNYPYTVLSLVSSLNMQYLDGVSAALGDATQWWLVRDTLQHSQVREFLDEQGYRTVFIASGFDFTDIRDGDEFIKPYPLQLNNFDSGFIRSTNLSALGDMGHLYSYPSYSTYRRIIQAGFEALPRVAPEAGPKFVFVHITAPHPPFVFDESGNPVNPDTPFTMIDKLRDMVDTATYKQSYIAELKYVNSQTLQAVRAILANSPTPPVIILQGDHGPGLYLNDEVADTCLYERYSILNAYYLPGRASADLPPTMTPVNSFRLIFNDYFSTHLAMLPDRNFFTNFSHFFIFQEVTGEITPSCAIKSQP